MALLLIETATGVTERADVDRLLERLLPAVVTAGATTVESRVTADLKRLFVVVEHDGEGADETLRTQLVAADVAVEDIAPVRLVGADLDDVKAAGGDQPRYLVEWDLPSDLTMERYLDRKREKSPLYEQVPEVAFRRTYVREDLDKCLCFYDAPCADDVYRAREVVSAPVDRFHELA
ncbi:MAG: DUF4242 domain-containing protein [Actinobacteria bacterium]|nr:DUF4242 domain-containing protein [Actinomycetota bacterium]